MKLLCERCFSAWEGLHMPCYWRMYTAPPVLLTNKDNDITISNMSNPSEPGMSAENHAL